MFKIVDIIEAEDIFMFGIPASSIEIGAVSRHRALIQ
jgi:hypothetical protein